MKYIEFKKYDTIGEYIHGYTTEYYFPLYVIANNIIVFIYNISSIYK
jgi:hypothetical protein